MVSLLHVSHAADPTDGGIAIAVADLVSAQRNSGLNPQWVTANGFLPFRRDIDLIDFVQSSAPELVHLHGLWRSPTRILPRIVASGKQTVVSPHGMLDSAALAISRRKKQVVWRFWERRALQDSFCLHALCPAEAEGILSVLPSARIAVIPNGVRIPNSLSPAPSVVPWAGIIPIDAPILLFFGRYHAKKGIEPLLHAWQTLASSVEQNGWWLAFVGYGDDGVLQRRVSSAQARGLLPQVFVGGPAFNDYKDAVLSGASAFVLPSFSEGLPMAALEAMAHRLPCLLSSACNLPEAFNCGAALLCEGQLDHLAAAMQNLFDLNRSDLKAMGIAGRALVADHYSWPQVAQQTKQLYQWILGGGQQPSFLYQP